MYKKSNTWNLSQWLDYIERCHPQTIDLGLERIQKVLAALNFSGFKCPVIKVAGTNGKGSVVALLSSIYRSAGYRVGTYTSPHLMTYNERIQINQQTISDQKLITLFEQIEQARKTITLSYFEYGTIAAFLYFLEHPLDLIILEIGMGGRLDAVNAVAAQLSIITNIELDHCEWLGDTREAIAQEKAGIIEPHATVICGEPDPHIANVIADYAAIQRATCYAVNKDYTYRDADEDTFDFFNVQSSDLSELCLPRPKLAVHNAAMAIMATKMLGLTLPVSRNALERGLRDVTLLGRQQRYAIAGCDVWLDVAHNPNAIAALADVLQSYYHVHNAARNKKFHLIFGMMADKDLAACLNILNPVVDFWHLCDLPSHRAAKATDIQMVFNDLYSAPANVQCHSAISSAYQVVRMLAQPGDVIVACGSFLVVTEMVTIINEEDE